jgi:hypothetical protein
MNMSRAALGRLAAKQRVMRLPRFLKILIVAQVFSAFVTESKFLPLKHNVGYFETMAVALAIVTAVYFISKGLPIRVHRAMLPLTLMAVVACISYYQLISATAERQSFAALSIVILVVALLMSVVWYNVVVADEDAPNLLLKAVAISTVIIALWVIRDSIGAGGNIAAAGPFRNRAHAGIYMHSAFWLVLAAANWPKTRGFNRILTYLAAALVLYIVSTSGRRSVYFALGLGMAGMVAAMAFSNWKTRQRVLTLLLVSAVSLGFVYFVLADFWEPAAFFKTRITMIDERLEAFTATSVEETDVDFIVLQRQGALHGFSEHPILGIGYGGFAHSEYSPTGHEVHSTPMRFLVELGLVGIALYLWFVLEAVGAGFRAWRNSRGGPYETAALILLVGILALSVSYAYNRQMTERVFWLYFAFLMVVDTRLRPIPKPPPGTTTRGVPVRRLRRLPPQYHARLGG